MHSTHYADANELEIAVNEHFIREIESAFGPETHFPTEFAAAFADFLFEATKLERLADRRPIFEIVNLDFPVSDLLTHLPLQRWPFPYMNTCPCSFCDKIIEPRSIDGCTSRTHAQRNF
jgi:hypothetical protein